MPVIRRRDGPNTRPARKYAPGGVPAASVVRSTVDSLKRRPANLDSVRSAALPKLSWTPASDTTSCAAGVSRCGDNRNVASQGKAPAAVAAVIVATLQADVAHQTHDGPWTRYSLNRAASRQCGQAMLDPWYPLFSAR